MSEDSQPKYLEASQIVYLPQWARYAVMLVLGTLALTSCIAGVVFFWFPDFHEEITPTLSIAQTAAGAFAVVLFVLFAERKMSTTKLLERTDYFLEQQITEGLRKIEVPQIKRGTTVNVNVLERAATIHGGRKDIFGANYRIWLEQYSMKMWVGLNVKRLSVIYFAQANGPEDALALEQIFRFTFGGAAKLGYDTNFQYVEMDGEKLVSIWTTVMADNVILGNPAEQLFWIQDIAMMTQSVIRTAVRDNIKLDLHLEPGPL